MIPTPSIQLALNDQLCHAVINNGLTVLCAADEGTGAVYKQFYFLLQKLLSVLPSVESFVVVQLADFLVVNTVALECPFNQAQTLCRLNNRLKAGEGFDSGGM